jgi:hypothetical protein
MTAPAYAPAIAFLRRAGLLAAVLTLMAGIFGMHVLTATHSMQSPAPAGATVSAHHGSSPAGHTWEHAPGPVSAPARAAAQGDAGTRTAQCTEPGSCTGLQSMTGSCTPSAKAGSLAAPLPGTGIIGRNIATGTPTASSAQWSYRPGSPSPGDLCISRT